MLTVNEVIALIKRAWQTEYPKWQSVSSNQSTPESRDHGFYAFYTFLLDLVKSPAEKEHELCLKDISDIRTRQRELNAQPHATLAEKQVLQAQMRALTSRISELDIQLQSADAQCTVLASLEEKLEAAGEGVTCGYLKEALQHAKAVLTKRGAQAFSSLMIKLSIVISYCDSLAKQQQPFLAHSNVVILKEAFELGWNEYQDPRLMLAALTRIESLLAQGINSTDRAAEKNQRLLDMHREELQEAGLLWSTPERAKHFAELLDRVVSIFVHPVGAGMPEQTNETRQLNEVLQGYYLDLIAKLPLRALFVLSGERSVPQPLLQRLLAKGRQGLVVMILNDLIMKRWHDPRIRGVEKISLMFEDRDCVFCLFQEWLAVSEVGAYQTLLTSLCSYLFNLLVSRALGRINLLALWGEPAFNDFVFLALQFYYRIESSSTQPLYGNFQAWKACIVGLCSQLSFPALLPSDAPLSESDEPSLFEKLLRDEQWDIVFFLFSALVRFWSSAAGRDEHQSKIGYFFNASGFLVRLFLFAVDTRGSQRNQWFNHLRDLFALVELERFADIKPRYLNWVEKSRDTPILLLLTQGDDGAHSALERQESSEVLGNLVLTLVSCESFVLYDDEFVERYLFALFSIVAQQAAPTLDCLVQIIGAYISSAKVAFAGRSVESCESEWIDILNLIIYHFYMHMEYCHFIAEHTLELLKYCAAIAPKLLLNTTRISESTDTPPLWAIFMSLRSKLAPHVYYEFLSLMFDHLPLVCLNELLPSLGITCDMLSRERSLISALNLDLKTSTGISVVKTFLAKKEFWEAFPNADDIRLRTWLSIVDELILFLNTTENRPTSLTVDEYRVRLVGLTCLVRCFELVWHNGFFVLTQYSPRDVVASYPSTVQQEQISSAFMTPARHLIEILRTAQEASRRQLMQGAMGADSEEISLAETIAHIEEAVYGSESLLFRQLGREERMLSAQACQRMRYGVGHRAYLLVERWSKHLILRNQNENCDVRKIQNLAHFLWLGFSDLSSQLDPLKQKAGRMALIVAQLRDPKWHVFTEVLEEQAEASILQKLSAFSDTLSQEEGTAERVNLAKNLLEIGIREILQVLLSHLARPTSANEAQVARIVEKLILPIWDLDLMLTDASLWSDSVPTVPYQSDLLFERVRDYLLSIVESSLPSSLHSFWLESVIREDHYYEMVRIALFFFSHTSEAVNDAALTFLWTQLNPSQKMRLWAFALDLAESFSSEEEGYNQEQLRALTIMEPSTSSRQGDVNGVVQTWVDDYFTSVSTNGDLEPLAAFLDFVRLTTQAQSQGRGRKLKRALVSVMEAADSIVLPVSLRYGLEVRNELSEIFCFHRAIQKLELFRLLHALEIRPCLATNIHNIDGLFMHVIGADLYQLQGVYRELSEEWAARFQNNLRALLLQPWKEAHDCIALRARIKSFFEELSERQKRDGTTEQVSLFHYLCASPALLNTVALELLQCLPDFSIAVSVPALLLPADVVVEEERLLPWLLRVPAIRSSSEKKGIILASRIALDEILHLQSLESRDDLESIFRVMTGASFAHLIRYFPGTLWRDGRNDRQELTTQFVSMWGRAGASNERELAHGILYELLVTLLSSIPLFPFGQPGQALSWTVQLNTTLLEAVQALRGCYNGEVSVQQVMIDDFAQLLYLLFLSDLQACPLILSQVLFALLKYLPNNGREIWQKVPAISVLRAQEISNEDTEERAQETLTSYLWSRVGRIEQGQVSVDQLNRLDILCIALASGASHQLTPEEEGFVSKILVIAMAAGHMVRPRLEERGMVSGSLTAELRTQYYQQAFESLYRRRAGEQLKRLFSSTQTSISIGAEQGRLVANISRFVNKKSALRKQGEAFLTLALGDRERAFKNLLLGIYQECLKNKNFLEELLSTSPKLFIAEVIRLPGELMKLSIKLMISLLQEENWRQTIGLPRVITAGLEEGHPLRLVGSDVMARDSVLSDDGIEDIRGDGLSRSEVVSPDLRIDSEVSVLSSPQPAAALILFRVLVGGEAEVRSPLESDPSPVVDDDGWLVYA